MGQRRLHAHILQHRERALIVERLARRREQQDHVRPMRSSPKDSIPPSGAVTTATESPQEPSAVQRGLHRVVRPAAWPIWVKLSFALLVASLVPMGLTSAYNLYRGLRSMEQAEYRNLELLATSTASRIDQLILDTQRTAAQVADEVEIVFFHRSSG
jgi:hypothetical protein